MSVTITPGRLSGTLSAPASKSCAHRALICAALSSAPTDIVCGPVGKDVQATAACLQALGADIQKTNYGWRVSPVLNSPKAAVLPCGESGSTLRFLLPIAGALGVDATFIMEGRLPCRPLSPLWEEMERMGCTLSRPTENTLLCRGRLRPGQYRMSGRVSSQFLSGLMLAMPLLPGSQLTVDGPIQSGPYVELTQSVMVAFPTERYTVEGDWSNAAFFLAANSLGSQITVTGLSEASAQGDRKILSLLKKLEKHCTVPAGDIPDLVPILAVAAACNKGAVFTDIARLRLKESDRIAAITAMLTALGGHCTAEENTLTVFPSALTGGLVDSFCDHRIAMAAAIAATVCTGPVTLLNAECTEKSYPHFWEDYQHLGGNLCKAPTPAD